MSSDFRETAVLAAAMELLGDANWWFPRWLGWLPKVNIDGNDLPALPGAVPINDWNEPSDEWERQPEPVVS